MVGTEAGGAVCLLTPLEQELLRLVDLGRNVGAAPLVRVVGHENEAVRLFDIINFRALADAQDLSRLRGVVVSRRGVVTSWRRGGSWAV